MGGLLVLAAAILPVGSVGAASEGELSDAEREAVAQINNVFRRAVARVKPSVVSLRIRHPKQAKEGSKRPHAPLGVGSGCIIDERGYIITNHHVLEDAEKIEVILADGRRLPAQEQMADPDTDLAVITIDPGDELLPAACFGDSDKAEVGDFVMAMGNPFGLSQTITVGIISFSGRQTGILDNRWGYEDFIQTDAAINQGNSGGPLVNLYGEVIGINSNILSPAQNGTSVGCGFAVPSNIARYVAEQLIDHGEVRRGYLGVSLIRFRLGELKKMADRQLRQLEVPPSMMRDLPGALEGVLVSKVEPGTPAAEAEMKRRDIITRINGRRVNSSRQLRDEIAKLTPGTEVKLEVWREGESQTIGVVLGDRGEARKDYEKRQKSERAGRAKRSKRKSKPSSSDKTFAWEELGAELALLTKDLAAKHGYEADEKGVVVVGVQSGGIAEENGLKAGDIVVRINDKEIKTLQEVEEIVGKVKVAESGVGLRVRDEAGERTLTVKRADDAVEVR